MLVVVVAGVRSDEAVAWAESDDESQVTWRASAATRPTSNVEVFMMSVSVCWYAQEMGLEISERVELEARLE